MPNRTEFVKLFTQYARECCLIGLKKPKAIVQTIPRLAKKIVLPFFVFRAAIPATPITPTITQRYVFPPFPLPGSTHLMRIISPTYHFYHCLYYIMLHRLIRLIAMFIFLAQGLIVYMLGWLLKIAHFGSNLSGTLYVREVKRGFVRGPL